MIVTSEVLTAVEELLENKDTNMEINAWLLENERLLQDWLGPLCTVGARNVDTGPAQLPESILSQVVAAMHNAANIGYVVATVANNALWAGEIDTSYVRSANLSDPGQKYAKWLDGKLPPRYYDPEELGVDVDKLGKEWDTARKNFEARMERGEAIDIKTTLIKMITDKSKDDKDTDVTI